jgi:hypothetical protein
MQGDTTHWSSASSPEEGASPLNVGTYLASSDSAQTRGATARGILRCGFMCHGKGKSGRSCRKMIKNHDRGAVCPDCMDESLFLQCSEGCLSYVHVECADSASSWTCPQCLAAKSVKGSSSSGNESESESAAGKERKIETMEFESYPDCHSHLRDNHFVIKKKRFNKQMQLTHVDYICEKSTCNAKLTVKRRGESDVWLTPLLVQHQVGTTSFLQCLFVQSPLIVSSGRMREQKETRAKSTTVHERRRVKVESYNCAQA